MSDIINLPTLTGKASTVLPFDFEGAAVRVVTIDGEPVFSLSDLCAILDIKNVGDAAKRLDEDEVINIAQTDVNRSRGNPNRLMVTEQGMYRLTMRSDKPSARRFTKWVAGVLVNLRKRGAHVEVRPGETDESIAARVSAAVAGEAARNGTETGKLKDRLIKSLCQTDRLRRKLERTAADKAIVNRRIESLVREQARLGSALQAEAESRTSEEIGRLIAETRLTETTAQADLYLAVWQDVHRVAGEVIRGRDAEIAVLRARPEPERVEIDRDTIAKAEAYDRLFNSAHDFGIREAAGVLKTTQSDLVELLLAKRWLYRRYDRNRSLAADSDRLRSGDLVEHVVENRGGRFETTGPAPFVTMRGLLKLAKHLNVAAAEIQARAGTVKAEPLTVH
jgi:prophage antirepressor-like protein/phage antirepressor YoqD-like protein